MAALGVTTRLAQDGAEIPSIAYSVSAIAEIQNPVALSWTSYLDDYDAAPTPVSFGGSFYDK